MARVRLGWATPGFITFSLMPSTRHDFGCKVRPSELARRMAMSDVDYLSKLDEIERLLNDPAHRMEPDRVWSLLAEVARHHTTGESTES